MTDLAGKKLGVYEVRQLIGRGGMAAVWSAYHPTTSREVAIKVLLPDLGKDATFRKRFEREGKILAGLQHIHILPVFDYGQQDDIAYLVMPLLPGDTLLNRLRDGFMDSQEVVRIFRQLAGALDYAHARGLLHRDIKPGNVLLDESHNAVLADFGLTRMADSSAMSRLTSDSSVVGTPAYMSPEQGQGLELDHRSDLYSMGVMLYEMLTGHVPYRADTPVAIIFKHISEPIPRLNLHRDDLPEEVEAVLQKAMAKSPEDRYSSATAIVDALEDALEGRSVPADSVLLSSHPSMMTPDVLKKPNFADGVNTLDFGMRPKRKRDENVTGSTLLKAMMLAVVAIVVAFAGITGVASGLISSSAMPSGTKPPATTVASANLTQLDAGAEILALAFNKEGTQIVAGLKDNTAGIWDMTTQKRLFALEAHSGDVVSVAFRPDGEEIITGGTDNTFYKWDAKDGTISVTGMESSSVRRVAYSQVYYAYTTRENLAAGQQDVKTGVSFFRSSPAAAPLISLDISPNESRIATGDDLGNVFIWRIGTGKVTQTFKGGDSPVISVAFTPDSNTVIAADETGTVRFWTIDDEADSDETIVEAAQTFTVGAGLNDMALSPDGSLMATAYDSGEIRYFTAGSSTTLLISNITALPVNALVFSPDGKWLAAGGDAKQIMIQPVSSIEPAQAP